MKPLITTCLAICAVACGSGGQGPADNPYRADTMPVNQVQTPSRPSDTVPPLDSQTPPLDSQTPPLDSQTPPLNSQLGGSAAASLSCTAAAAAISGLGCTVSADDLEYCETWSAPASPCASLLQSFIACAIQHPVCDNKGKFDRTRSCAELSSSVETCVSTYTNDQVVVTCSKATQCKNCANACVRCVCQADGDTAALDRCANDCTNTTR